jgi:hypothetical protein
MRMTSPTDVGIETSPPPTFLRPPRCDRRAESPSRVHERKRAAPLAGDAHVLNDVAANVMPASVALCDSQASIDATTSATPPQALSFADATLGIMAAPFRYRPLDKEPADAAIPPKPDAPRAPLDALSEDEAPADLPEGEAWEPTCPDEQPPPKAAANATTRGRKKRPREPACGARASRACSEWVAGAGPRDPSTWTIP